MKAVRFAEYGGPEVLRVVEVEEPHAGARQVRIAVRAAGVNPIDWKIRAGHMREMMPMTLPAGMGLDAAGVVDEVGEGVRGTAVGDAVFGSGSATYAEYAVLSNWAAKPARLTNTVLRNAPSTSFAVTQIPTSAATPNTNSTRSTRSTNPAGATNGAIYV